MKLKDFKKQLLKDPEFKKEYEKYDLAFEIGEMLLEARIIKGITQQKLAEMIGTKQSGVARAERGISLPSLSFLEKIAKAFCTNLIVRFGFMDKNNIKISENNTKPYRTTAQQSFPFKVGIPAFACSDSNLDSSTTERFFV